MIYTCSHSYCHKPIHCRGLCSSHYMKAWRKNELEYYSPHLVRFMAIIKDIKNLQESMDYIFAEDFQRIDNWGEKYVLKKFLQFRKDLIKWQIPHKVIKSVTGKIGIKLI